MISAGDSEKNCMGPPSLSSYVKFIQMSVRKQVQRHVPGTGDKKKGGIEEERFSFFSGVKGDACVRSFLSSRSSSNSSSNFIIFAKA